MHQNTTSDTIRKHNPLHIEEYSPCKLPLTEKIKHLKLNYYLRDSISHWEPNILPTLKLKMAHHESVTFSKYPRPENCIISSVKG